MQMEAVGRKAELDSPYHRAVLDGQLPLSMGGGIGQVRASSTNASPSVSSCTYDIATYK
jgi:asparagine synthetase A